MVYIRVEDDTSALTYPNTRQAVCYPGGGGAGGGDREEGRKREKSGGMKQTGTRGSVPLVQSTSHLCLRPRGENSSELTRLNMTRDSVQFRVSDLDLVSDTESF